MKRLRLCGPVLLAFLVFLGPAARAQEPELRDRPRTAEPVGIEEEDLDDVAFDQVAPAPLDPAAPEIGVEPLRALLAEAEAVFRSQDRLASLPLFGNLVDRVESYLVARREAAEGEPGPVSEEPPDAGEAAAPDAGVPPSELPPEVRFLGPEARSIFVRALEYRARLHASLGEDDLAQAGLERMLEVDPGATPADEAVAELERLHERARRQRVGELAFLTEPPDLEVWIDGRPADPLAGPVAALAGERWLEAERPGYAPVARRIEVAAGRQTTVELALERTSPVVRLHTRPTGATVLVDGEVRGATEGSAPDGFLPGVAAGAYRPGEFSAELALSEIEPGLRVLEVRKEGFRPYRAELELTELIDYPMPPIVLVPEAGTLILRDLPPDAEIRVNGEVRRPDDPGAATARLTLPPGEHELVVTSGAARMFQRRLLLADRQTMEVQVRLRPGLAFLGVLGGDRAGAERLAESIRRSLQNSEKWAFLDRSSEGPAILAGAGMTAAALADPDAVDWKRVQATADRQAPGLVYVAALVSGDLLADAATLLVWPGAPGPPRPDRVAVPLSEPGALDRVLAGFDRRPRLVRPWTGALVVDSGAVPHPVVAAVTPGSPAEAAGLRPGEQILGVGQVPVLSRSGFEERLAAAGAGEALEFAVRGLDGDARTLQLRPGLSPLLLEPHQPGRLDALTFAELGLMAEEAPHENRWVIRFNRGLLLLWAGEWEAAARALRDVGAPQGSHGLNQAAVDYYLGLALAAAGRQYREAARASLERAAAAEGARLEHHDGPYLAPRAKARLRGLGLAAPP